MLSILSTDVAIIGAGPVGLFAVFQCGMLKLSTQVIDALPASGGQCTALYPEKPIYDIPGSPQINAETLIAQLEKQIAPFNPQIHLDQQVVSLERDGSEWLLSTSKSLVIRAKAVIIAAGAGAFGPNK
ncbi:MAG TPA: ferredoxin--NADP(+) reductase, partial [Porticoccaceae bacterium]|nr:ferredoxin--NADP(+) reductase [Porticoccaceae bacterium]